MHQDLARGDQSFHAPFKFRLIQLPGGFLQVELLPFQPGGRRKNTILGQSPGHLGGRAGGLLHHQGFEPLEIRAARVTGKPGDRGIGNPQALGQLPMEENKKASVLVLM